MSHFAYVTVLSEDKDLPGVVILAFSLRKTGSHLPLVVVCSNTVSSKVLDALRSEAARPLDMTVEVVDLNLPGSLSAAESSASASKKKQFKSLDPLLAFAPPVWAYETVCYLSPTSVIARHGMDLIFSEAQLPTDSCIAAVPQCTCLFAWNLHLGAPACPFSTQSDPRTPLRKTMSFSASVVAASPVEPGAMAPKNAGLDGRVVVFYPGEMLWDRMKKAYLEEGLEEDGEGQKSSEDTNDEPKDNIENNGGHGELGKEKSQGNEDVRKEKVERHGSSSRLLEKVFKDKWAALPWYYCVSERLRRGHWSFVAGNDTSSICYQVQQGEWKSYDRQRLQDKKKSTPFGESAVQGSDAVVVEKETMLNGGDSNDKLNSSKPETSSGKKKEIESENEVEQERMPLRLITSLMEGHGRAFEIWTRMYEAWKSYLLERGEDGKGLVRLVEGMMGIQHEGTSTMASSVRTENTDGRAKTLKAILTPINEASPASEGHHPARGFESAYLSMYRPKPIVERGHGPVVHRHKPVKPDMVRRPHCDEPAGSSAQS